MRLTGTQSRFPTWVEGTVLHELPPLSPRLCVSRKLEEAGRTRNQKWEYSRLVTAQIMLAGFIGKGRVHSQEGSGTQEHPLFGQSTLGVPSGSFSFYLWACGLDMKLDGTNGHMCKCYVCMTSLSDTHLTHNAFSVPWGQNSDWLTQASGKMQSGILLVVLCPQLTSRKPCFVLEPERSCKE